MKIFGNSLDYAHRSEKTVSDVLRRLDDQKIKHLFTFGLINRNLSNTDHEADLILVGPAGVFLIEIKSGPIRVEDGQYYRGNNMLKSPIMQAKQAWYDLQEHLKESGLPIKSLRFGGYCALYLDVSWSGGDTDADGLIMDRNFLNNPVDSLAKVVETRTAAAMSNSWRIDKYSAGEIAKVKDAIVSNSYQAPSVRIAIDESEAIYADLGVEQSVVYSAISNNKRIRIFGPPGSGKTLLAFQVLRDNFRQGIKTLYICKNKALANMLCARFEDEYGKQDVVTIKTIDSLIYSSLRILNMKINVGVSEPYTEKAKRLKHELEVGIHEGFSYACLVVDEAQDVLNLEYCDLLNTIVDQGLETGSWRLFLDPEQDVFSGYEKETLDLYFNDSNSVEYILQKNYRNTIEIQKAAKAFSKHNYEITSEKNPLGEPPEIIIYKKDDWLDSANTTSKAINDLLSAGVKPSEITILSFVARRKSVADRNLLRIANGVKLVHINDRDWNEGSINKIYYASVYEYKGLDNKVIVYTDIDRLGDDERSRIAHFVGATRAKVYYVMLVSSDIALKLIEEIGKSPLGEFGERISGSDIVSENGYEKLVKVITRDRQNLHIDEGISENELMERIVGLLRNGSMGKAEISSRLGANSKSVMAHLSENRDKLYYQGSDLRWSLIE